MVEKFISVIITSYNHGKYLGYAIESVLRQSYKHFEVVVIDDGSTDDTGLVVNQYPGIKYIYQENKGVSAARNLGIEHSSGEYLCFLDADDWLLPDALETNLGYIKTNDSFAFVSGAYMFAHVRYPIQEISSSYKLNHEEVSLVNEPKEPVIRDYYAHFLKGNYIGMHAAVLYNRWVFDEFKFDRSISRCEDYDLFLKITREYNVLDHSKPIAVYRLHGNNTTSNSMLMLNAALKVLEAQREKLKNAEEIESFNEGKRLWPKVYSNLAYQKLVNSGFQGKYKAEDFQLLWIYDKKLYINCLIKKTLMEYRKVLKKITPSFVLRGLRQLRFRSHYTPPVGKIKLGDFGRLDPFSRAFGYDRGGPIDRYYIENFLKKNSGLIKGRVLEIGDNEYTLRFGGTRVTKSDILHVNASNSNATIIGDLADAPQIPSDSFDCILLTQTLHLIYDYKKAIETCQRILRPGGVLLVTTPGITSIDYGEWKSTWYWAFTDIAIQRMLEETFSQSQVNVEAFGNILAATTFLYGMGITEVKTNQLDFYDPSYQVTITATATKS